MNYSFKWVNNNAIVTFNKNSNYEDILNADEDIYTDSRFDLMNFTIYDLSKAINLNLTEIDLKIFSISDKSAALFLNKKIKLAFVIQQQNVKDMISMYTEFMKASSWEIKIFDTLSKAKEWVENE